MKIQLLPNLPNPKIIFKYKKYNILPCDQLETILAIPLLEVLDLALWYIQGVSQISILRTSRWNRKQWQRRLYRQLPNVVKKIVDNLVLANCKLKIIYKPHFKTKTNSLKLNLFKSEPDHLLTLPTPWVFLQQWAHCSFA